MQVINTGTSYRIYDESVKTYDTLPAGFYQVDFSQMGGFYLTRIHDLEIPEKIYGSHLKKSKMVMKSFELFSRNLGIILSGPKGIGKSLFARILAKETVLCGYPVILVKEHIDGISNFIESIDQQVCILFDEFDKTFKKEEAQNEMLSLFDGLSVGKKLFVVTCNHINSLNEYLVNRPGRFHYHLRFDYLSADEIQEYMEDNIPEEFYDQIKEVVSFSHKVQLNYDCLRAISFEIAMGRSFRESIQDLNIINVSREKYTVEIFFNDGSYCSKDSYMDLFDNQDNSIYMSQNNKDFYVHFKPCDVRFDPMIGSLVLDSDKIQIDWDLDDDEVEPQKKIVSTRLKIKTADPIHYTV